MGFSAPLESFGHHTTRELGYNWLRVLMAHEVTLLLQEIGRGGNENRAALDRLLPIVYDELRRLAASFLRREHGVSLQTTELVHEAYFKLTDQRQVDWENRGQFLPSPPRRCGGS